jgi:hypothetical protein
MKHVERLNVLCGGVRVGVLAMAGRAKIVFEYAPQWLANGFDVAPRSLNFTNAPQLAKDKRQLERAFRLMVFNVLTHNKDDHAKNFSFIWQGALWELAPAYDLTFNHGMGGEHIRPLPVAAIRGQPNC